ncbi:hypothetical protein HUG15_09225 [Salicibibacter cibarius]|uniref:Uncharacterized protein n=1 Tax=Salicibibacter cibarius TaxID=2743000 RepID=A0A7T6Z2G4_9BACI|nr:hypothetical protein HUG15_09225 [Salicibibacter cibarius]
MNNVWRPNLIEAGLYGRHGTIMAPEQARIRSFSSFHGVSQRIMLI